RAAADEERVGRRAHEGREGRIDLATGAGVEDLDLPPESARSWFHIPQDGLGVGRISRIDEYGHTSRCGHQLAQELEPFRRKLSREKINTCQVAARPGETGDKAEPDRVITDGENDGDRRACRLGGECGRRAFGRNNHGDLPANEFAGQRWQPVILTFRPAVFDRYVLALDIADLLQAPPKCAQTLGVTIARCRAQARDPPHRPALLRARRKRPRRRRAAEKRDELATFHSITSSARASSVGGTSRPIVLAVCRLMTNSNFTARRIGRSAGFSPL